MKNIKSSLLIRGRRIYLRKISLKDINKDYISWMNDAQVVRFLESRFQKWSIKKIKAYVKEVKNKPDYLFLAIVLNNGKKHIGNIKIGPINLNHNFADMGLIIGEKSYWGQGFATEAIKLITDYAFNELSLHKITAGVYSNNIGSIKAFKKAGFVVEAVRKKHYLYKDKYVDAVLLSNTQKRSL